jgi:putative transposase
LEKGRRRKKKRLTDEQIVAVLREHELGATAAELGRKHGISPQTLCNWKSQYGGMDGSEARRLKSLETETLMLTRLLADAHLDNAALNDLLSRKR